MSLDNLRDEEDNNKTLTSPHSVSPERREVETDL